MIQSVYASADRLRTGLHPKDIEQALKSGEGLLWVDVTGQEQEALDLLHDTLHFHPLAIEDCFDDNVTTAKADDYGDYLFLITQDATYDASTRELSIREVGVFLGANYVVSVHKQALPEIEELLGRAGNDGHVTQRGPDFLAHSILDRIVDELRPVVESMDEQLDELQTRIVAQPNQSQLHVVMGLKRNALRLRRILLSQADLMSRLSRHEFPQYIQPETAIFYRDIYDHLVREEILLESVRELSDSALNYYLSATNNRMNEVMKALSVVAAIFLPLTLIASIFGTNLDYSPFGLTLDAGFYLMIAIMLVIAGAMIAFFRARHWF